MAKVYLDSGDNFTLASVASVYGATGTERVIINTGVAGVVVDANVERVDLPGASTAFIFQQAGNQLKVYSGASLVASIPLQDDANGTQVVFSNGSADAKFVTTTTPPSITLGGTAVPSTTAGSVTPATMDTAITSGSSSSTGAGGGGGSTSQVLTLTSGIDVVTGSSGNDTLIGSQATLNPGDSLNGGSGIDVLTINSNAATTFGAFSAANIETVQTTAIGGASVVNLSNASGVTTVSNVGSDSNVSFDQLQTLSTVAVSNTAPTTGSTVHPNLTALFKDTVLSGSADTATVTLNNAKVGVLVLGTVTSAGGAANGVETIQLITSGGASTITTLGGAGASGLSTLKVSGDQALTITNALADLSVQAIDASSLTSGGLTIDVTGNTQAMTVTGSAGNDDVTFNEALTSADQFDGAAGTDTLRVQTIAQVDAADNLANIKNVEVLRFTSATSGTLDVSSTGANAASIPSSMTNFTFGAGLNGATILNGLSTGATIGIIGDVASNALAFALKTNSANDTLTLAVTNPAGANSTINSLTATGFEDLTLGVTDSVRTTKEGVVINMLTDADLAKITMTGSGNVTINASNAAKLATINAAALTGDLSLSALGSASTTAMSITGGSGADVLAGGSKADNIVGGAGNDTIIGSVGADTINGGEGADIFSYTLAEQSGTSTSSGTDTIIGFVSGVDKFDFSNIGGNSVLFFRGVHATTTQAINALSGGGSPSSGLDAVFVSSENALVVDVNDDGQIDANDLYIKLNGITSITTADLGVAAAGNTITLTAANASTSTSANNANASAKTTAYDDVISTTLANLSGSTVTGGLGNDSLQLTTAGTANINDAGTGGVVTQVESLVLAAGTNSITFTAGSGIKNITGNSGSDTITTSNITSGGALALGDGNDTVNLTGTMVSTSIDFGAGEDALISTVGGTIAMSLAGGAGTDVLSLANADDIKGATISGFENLTIASGGSVTMTNAQYAMLTGGTVTAAGTETVTISDAAAIAAVTVIEHYSFGNSGNNFTSSVTADQSVTGGAGVDTFTFTAGLTTADTLIGGTGTDVLNINYDTAGINLNGTATMLQGVESLVFGVNQTGAITVDAEVTTLTASNQTSAITFTTAGVSLTNVTLGAGNETVSVLSNGANTATYALGSGDEVVTDLAGGVGDLTLDAGAGNLTVTDLSANAGKITIKAQGSAGSTTNITFAATTADLNSGDVVDFNLDVAGIVTTGGAVARQVIITSGVDTTILFDVDGNNINSTGDVLITLTGQNLAATALSIVSGNLVVI